MSAIVTLTMNPSLDVNADVERVVPDDKLRCGDPTFEAGGGGLNVAQVAARLGEDCRAVFTCGGAFGELVVRLIEDQPFSCDPLPIADATRQNPTFSETATDDQYRFVFPGPELAEEEWRRCIEHVASLDPPPSVLVASGSLPPGVPADFYARLCAAMGDHDTKLVVDASGEALRATVETGAFLLKPNAQELRDLCRGELFGDDDASYEAAADALVERGAAEVLVLSLGAGGAYVAQRGSPGVSLRSPTVPIASRIGAGDSMVAGIVTGLVRGWEITDAVRLGLAAGAAAVMTAGTELARAADVERLYERVERPSS